MFQLLVIIRLNFPDSSLIYSLRPFSSWQGSTTIHTVCSYICTQVLFTEKIAVYRIFQEYFLYYNTVLVPDTASYIRGWMQMVLTPNDLFSWNNKYSKHMVILLRYIHYNGFIARLPAMHVNLLCACWYPWAVKGSSSLSFCRLPIYLRFTSCLLLCTELTDAPHSGPGTRPPFLFQNGVFIHRIRTLSLSRIQDNWYCIHYLYMYK
jgi:hypothetical protein